MRKNQATKVIVHFAKPEDREWLREQAAAFYVEQVEQKIGESELSAEQQVAVVQKLIKILKGQEK